MMVDRKKLLIIIGGGVGIVIAVLAIFFIFQKKQAPVVSPIQTPGITQEKKPENLITYKDTAGFSFNYPENLTVRDVSGDEQTVYSSLELSSLQDEEKMIIKVSDTTFASVDAWLKSKEATGAGSTREITLSGMPGSQIQFTNPRRLVTIAIDEGIMYFIESPLDEAGLWSKIHNDIISSFTIDQTQTSSPQVGGEEVIYEEEEVIE